VLVMGGTAKIICNFSQNPLYSLLNISNIGVLHNLQKNRTKTPWPESASELYRQSDSRLSVKLVSSFADRGVSRGQRGESPTAVISVFYTRVATFSFK
jgi:hypothetical protein